MASEGPQCAPTDCEDGAAITWRADRDVAMERAKAFNGRVDLRLPASLPNSHIIWKCKRHGQSLLLRFLACLLLLALVGLNVQVCRADPATERPAEASAPAAFIRRLQAGETITIVTMGTSLTGGNWRWPDVMMGDWLNKEFPGKVHFFNEAVSGSASSVGPGGKPSLSGFAKLPAVLAHKPDVVFIEFATNDAYLPYKISQEDSRKNLNAIIDRILEANPRTEIILQTMNSVKDNPKAGAASLHATNRPELAAYMQGYREVAQARGLRLVDHYPNWKKIMDEDPDRFDRLVPDRIHPQLEGWREVLLPELKQSLAGDGGKR